MGHACQIKTFDATMSKGAIQAECDEWGNYNADLEERCGCLDGLGFPIRFTDKVFDSEKDAFEYLNGTFGNYSQTAVRYRSYKGVVPTKKKTELTTRLFKAKERLSELNKDHYVGVTYKTVKCKCCGSSFATEYCGRSWHNRCLVCNTDLRPQSKLDAIDSCKKTILGIENSIEEENRKIREKNKKNSTLRWAVACEVHC